MKQGEKEITNYFIEMMAFWQELNLSFNNEWECVNDSAPYKKKLETERVFEFLVGLNHDLDDVRSHILSYSPLPSTCEVF